jgi:hypothetical protein
MAMSCEVALFIIRTRIRREPDFVRLQRGELGNKRLGDLYCEIGEAVKTEMRVALAPDSKRMADAVYRKWISVVKTCKAEWLVLFSVWIVQSHALAVL